MSSRFYYTGLEVVWILWGSCWVWYGCLENVLRKSEYCFNYILNRNISSCYLNSCLDTDKGIIFMTILSVPKKVMFHPMLLLLLSVCLKTTWFTNCSKICHLNHRSPKGFFFFSIWISSKINGFVASGISYLWPCQQRWQQHHQWW